MGVIVMHGKRSLTILSSGPSEAVEAGVELLGTGDDVTGRDIAVFGEERETLLFQQLKQAAYRLF